MALINSDMDDLKYEIEEEAHCRARIKVIGVGGGGCNAVARMAQTGMEGVEFFAMNTDLQALTACPVLNKLQLGVKMTNGLGAGSNPEIGRQAALENTDHIVEMLQGADMVFVTAGLGGGTGTGAAPVIASLAKELDALTVAVVTQPFTFEGTRRQRLAEQGLAQLASVVDTVIAIPNDRLLALVPRGASFVEGFKMADDLLRQAVQGISDIMVTPGLINRDFSDVKATMVGMGYAMLGTAVARGDHAAVEAARQAISCPLLEDSRIAGSTSVLINITGSSRLGLHDVNEACSIIQKATASEDVQISFGVILNEAMQDAVKVTVIAAGFQPEDMRPSEPWRLPEIVVETPRPEPQPESDTEVDRQLELDAPLPAEAEPVLNLDDLDTPAYLRQGRLLN